MDYWESYVWVYVLGLYLTALCFSRNVTGAWITALFLLSTNIAPVIFDSGGVDGFLTTTTLNGAISCAFLIAAVYFGQLVVASIIFIAFLFHLFTFLFAPVISDTAYFTVAYSIEISAVFAGMFGRARSHSFVNLLRNMGLVDNHGMAAPRGGHHR